MTSQTVVATANVIHTLPAAEARLALETVLDLAPDLVGLQEWGLRRSRLLLEKGEVGLVPGLGVRVGGQADSRGYVWSAAVLGGCAVGARSERFELLTCRARLLSRVGRADKPDRWFGIEPPRIALLATYRDKLHDRTVALLGYHLVAGVETGGSYRVERPLLTARHRHEVRRLQSLVDEQLAAGHSVYAVGDSNFNGLLLSGLTSAWEGRPDAPGTLGRRKIDDVHGPGAATAVTQLEIGSDHKAVVAVRPDR